MDENNKPRQLKVVIILLSIIMIIQLTMLSLMIPNKTTIAWITIITVAIAVIYILALSWGLVKELYERSDKPKK